MPGKVKVKVLAGRNLPVMDKGSDTTDAYVEIKLGNVTHKTDICRKSLNPQWNSSEWYRFEMDDAELQDEPLQLRLMDHDTYSANDAIGKVYISLNPLLLPEAQQHPHHATPAATHSGKGSVMSGWIPVFDTMHGIRGEVNVIVKVELFNDFNKFRQSSCGVQFFHSPIIPHGYQAQVIHGFVEELVINDDPEYQWIDKIRTPRASNEARQVAFLKLSGQVQRKIGLKALELGANAVIGFRRCLDLEGDVGVVARGAGTAVTLIHQQEPPLQSNNGALNIAASPDTLAQSGGAAVINPAPDCGSPRHARADSHGGKPPPTSNLNINSSHRRSSDSDLSITPKGNSLTAGVCGGAVLRPTMNQESIDMLEYPFLTIIKFPPGFILHIGGAVAARSVKLLERVPNPEEPAPRDAWWSELRTEVRSHMRALRCNAVLAYQETTTICDDVCVLSATGTAAVIDLHPSATMPHTTAHPGSTSTTASGKVKPDSSNNNSAKIAEGDAGRAELTQTSSLDRTDFEKNEQSNSKHNSDNNNRRRGGGGERCGPCHVPYSSGSVPYRVSVSKCALCKKGRVPSVVLCSVEPIEGLAIIGRGCLLQAVASRARTPARGEPAARDISDQLPFLEYELHRLLLAKLRVRGMNAIFGLKTTIAVGSGVVAAVGVGTGVLLAALGPGTGGPRLRAAPGDPHHLQGLQQKLDEAFQDNRKVYQLNTDQESNGKAVVASDTEDSDEELPDVDLGSGNKDTCVLEVDDAEDLEVLRVLTEARPPAGLHVVNTQSVPGLLGCGLVSVRNLQMFTQLWRARLSSPPGALHPHFHRLLLSVYFKLRRMVPCAVCDLRFRLDLPEADEIQLVVTGMAVGLTEAVSVSADGKLPKVVGSPLQISVDTTKKADTKDVVSSDPVKKSESSEMIFTLEEESIVDVNGPSKFNVGSPAIPPNTQNTFTTTTSATPSWRPGVDMTPLAGVPGAKVERYLGNLDFVFVRESTSIRELGGLSGFLHSFITEVLAVVRAHVTALGGNAIVAFYMTELILSDSPHKNQAQCLVSVGGDVVFVSYFPTE